MILTGYAIEQAVADGEIQIDPFVRKNINPASYDLTLGDEVAVYDRWVTPWCQASLRQEDSLVALKNTIDTRDPAAVTRYKIGPSGWTLRPGIGYLLHTHERICARTLVGAIDGKSSLGRLFIQVHATAGYIDPGFDGQITLEVTVTHKALIHAGMRFAQIRFHKTEGAVMPYSGNYVGETAKGPVASRSWNQFKT